MDFIILDDSEYKRERIKSYIETINPVANITEYECARDLLVHLRELRFADNKDEICKNTMIFLDWNFPFYKGERVEAGQGSAILSELRRVKLPLSTVIVSSDEVEYDEDRYDFVLGSILDDSSVYQKDEYKNFICGVSKNIDEIKNDEER